MRHQLDVHGDTLADLERALGQLKMAGAPDTATVRLRVKTAFNADGGTARTLTARWDPQETGGAQ